MKKVSIFAIFILCILTLQPVKAQNQEEVQKAKLSFRDTLDNCFDLSDFVINKKGFVPMPIIITEPALGGFGGALAPVFIQPNKPKEVNGKVIPLPPNATALFGGYTLNDSWAVGGGRSASIPKWGLRYAIGGAYMNVNMDYYFHPDKLNKDVEAEFNIRSIPVFFSVTKQLKDPRYSVALRYLFMHNDLEVKTPAAGPLQQKIDDLVRDYLSGDIGKLGVELAYDNRDNVFTPNKGLKTYITADWSNPVFASDYKYGQFEGALYCYFPLRHNLITGTRFDVQQVVGDIPFYIKPFIDMRGVPTARYQGKTTALVELEERWDFKYRWSLVFFGGTGKGFDKFSEFDDAEWAWSYGAGFRYLMARKLNLRMGVDFAMGPEGFAYYLVFGTSWLRQ